LERVQKGLWFKTANRKMEKEKGKRTISQRRNGTESTREREGQQKVRGGREGEKEKEVERKWRKRKEKEEEEGGTKIEVEKRKGEEEVNVESVPKEVKRESI